MDAAIAMDPHLESMDKTVGGTMRVANRGCVLLIGMIAIADDDFRFRGFDPLMIDSHGSYANYQPAPCERGKHKCHTIMREKATALDHAHCLLDHGHMTRSVRARQRINQFIDFLVKRGAISSRT